VFSFLGLFDVTENAKYMVEVKDRFSFHHTAWRPDQPDHLHY